MRSGTKGRRRASAHYGAIRINSAEAPARNSSTGISGWRRRRMRSPWAVADANQGTPRTVDRAGLAPVPCCARGDPAVGAVVAIVAEQERYGPARRLALAMSSKANIAIVANLGEDSPRPEIARRDGGASTLPFGCGRSDRSTPSQRCAIAQPLRSDHCRRASRCGRPTGRRCAWRRDCRCRHRRAARSPR